MMGVSTDAESRSTRRTYATKASFPATSPLVRSRVRFWNSILAGAIAGLSFLVVNYATLFVIPRMELASRPRWGGALFFDRFDLAQFVGAFFDPPYPTPATWILGIVLLYGLLICGGFVYALLLAWSLRGSTVGRGAGFGVGMFAVTGFGIGLANGIHPAVMRYAIPDTGFYFLGWTGWATIQFLIVFVIYGLVLGAVYRMRAR